MEIETITILGESITKEHFPILWKWAKNDKDGLERRIKSDLQGDEKVSTLLVMLELDLEEKRLK
jgi:hypothetical protein